MGKIHTHICIYIYIHTEDFRLPNKQISVKITLLDNPQIYQGLFSTSGIIKEKVETGLGKPESMGIISPVATILLLGYSSCKYTCDMSSLRNISHQRD